VIPSGRSGWLKLVATQDRAITGAAINFNRRDGRERGAFSGQRFTINYPLSTLHDFARPRRPPKDN
jgi:hypothetical protein